MTLREDAETIMQKAIRASLPDAAVAKALELMEFGTGKIVVVAIGKAAWQMAKTAVGILDGRISAGIVITKYGHSKGELAPLEIWEAGHPVPDENSFAATEKALALVRGLAAEDTVLFLLSGGGSALRPGEMSLADNGVLFLDELPEFSPAVLEPMRQPLEDGSITISRATGSVTYPSRFMLVCAMNPCKCGWYGHPSGRCRCAPRDVRRYHARVSGPLLDRIDIIVEVPALEFDELTEPSAGEPSRAIRARVNAARAVQRARYGDDTTTTNAHMGPRALAEFCALSPECEQLMHQAFDSMALTARSYDRILRVARTIADLDGAQTIGLTHLAEAIQYRTYDFSVAEP